MCCKHPALSATICESCMGPTIYYVANVGIKEKALKDADPIRQAVVKLVLSAEWSVTYFTCSCQFGILYKTSLPR